MIVVVLLAAVCTEEILIVSAPVRSSSHSTPNLVMTSIACALWESEWIVEFIVIYESTVNVAVGLSSNALMSSLTVGYYRL